MVKDCAFYGKSTKFGTKVDFDILIIFGYGPKKNIQDGGHFQDGRRVNNKFVKNHINRLLLVAYLHNFTPNVHIMDQ